MEGEEDNESGGEGGGGGEAKPKLITQVSTETTTNDGVSSPSEEKIGKRTAKDWKLNEQLSMEEVVDPGNNGQVVAMEEEEDEDEVTCDKKEAPVSQYKSTSINSRRSAADVQEEEEEDSFFVRDKNDETPPKKKSAPVSSNKKISHKPLRFRPSTTAKLYKNKLPCAHPTCAAEFLTQHQLWRHSLLSHGSVVGQKLNRQLREIGQQQQQQLEAPCGQCQQRRRLQRTSTTFPLSIARSTYRFYMIVSSKPPRALPATTLTSTTVAATVAAKKLRQQKTVSATAEIPTLINMNEPRLTRKRSSMALGLTTTTEGTPSAPAAGAAAGIEQKPVPPPSGANAAKRPKKYRNFCKVCSVGFPKQRELKAHYQSKDHRERSNAAKNAAAAAKSSTRLKVNGLTTTEPVQPQTPKGAVVVTKTEREEPTFLALAPPPSLIPRSPRVRTSSITAAGRNGRRVVEPRSLHSSGNLTCETCHTSFWSTYELKRHYATLKHQQAVAAAGGDKEASSDNEIYECETCETGYRTESQLKRHCSSIVHQNRVADRAQTSTVGVHVHHGTPSSTGSLTVGVGAASGQGHSAGSKRKLIPTLTTGPAALGRFECVPCGMSFQYASQLTRHEISYRHLSRVVDAAADNATIGAAAEAAEFEENEEEEEEEGEGEEGQVEEEEDEDMAATGAGGLLPPKTEPGEPEQPVSLIIEADPPAGPPGLRLNRCEICDMDFNSRWNLTRHLRRGAHLRMVAAKASGALPLLSSSCAPAAQRQQQQQQQGSSVPPSLFRTFQRDGGRPQMRQQNWRQRQQHNNNNNNAAAGNLGKWYCQICKTLFSTPHSLRRHLSSPTHMSKIAEAGTLRTLQQQQGQPQPQQQQHDKWIMINGANRSRSLGSLGFSGSAALPAPPRPRLSLGVGRRSPEFKDLTCHICQVAYSGIHELKRHFTTMKHKRAQRRIEMGASGGYHHQQQGISGNLIHTLITHTIENVRIRKMRLQLDKERADYTRSVILYLIRILESPFWSAEDTEKLRKLMSEMIALEEERLKIERKRVEDRRLVMLDMMNLMEKLIS